MYGTESSPWSSTPIAFLVFYRKAVFYMRVFSNVDSSKVEEHCRLSCRQERCVTIRETSMGSRAGHGGGKKKDRKLSYGECQKTIKP